MALDRHTEMTYSTLPGKAICRIVWNMDGEKNLRYLERALSGVPEVFSGKLLEVPVGTGVLTMPVYRELPGAGITCLDYSPDMMATAQERAKKAGIGNVRFVQGDVGALPFEDESFDIVLSLNGFHAFPDKDAAYRETFRVLKKGGTFCGCFYIRGGCARTDWFISHLYQPKGFFTPPYETEMSLRQRLSGLYSTAEVTRVEGIAREVADVTIAAEDLRELVLLRKLSQKLMGRIDRNYRFVMGFNGALIALGAVGVHPPATSALLHNSSTLLLSMDCMTPLLPEGGTA